MQLKKIFEKPEIEVIKFEASDVITASFESARSYDLQSIKDFFNING